MLAIFYRSGPRCMTKRWLSRLLRSYGRLRTTQAGEIRTCLSCPLRKTECEHSLSYLNQLKVPSTHAISLHLPNKYNPRLLIAKSTAMPTQTVVHAGRTQSWLAMAAANWVGVRWSTGPSP